ncbi:Phosphate-selective porin O and P superfamily protein [Ignavibacterium album JCM 16511]|uniref:Phosphate-selective porin O and P superfamily protein n=1 Tax=Ignavibacterium album (strain DSM 19864 / JCM 16511 / NBRC 101810 / Mat9-16) TaxID=945713 RepID=I0ANH6_IGNAJ|nr:Phosphate-selective porin O and P superfamily protein [Ignavibacterium album JCM 16511]
MRGAIATKQSDKREELLHFVRNDNNPVIARDNSLEAISKSRTDYFATLVMTNTLCHCEERSDEAISISKTDCFTPFHFVRNDIQAGSLRGAIATKQSDKREGLLHFVSNDSLKLFFLIFLLLSLPLFAQNENPEFHGYIQSRFTYNDGNSSSFMIRRAKLWLDGKAPMADNITYKMQVVYRSATDENFYFQDAFADVKWNFGFLRVGKFVPNFTLQRMQSDAFIPVLERANVINNLIHGDKSSAREIGVEGNFDLLNSNLKLSLGIFNGNQKVPGNNISNNLLYSSKISYDILKNKDELINIGASFGYRYLDNQTLSKIFSSTQSITGNDYRYGFQTELKLNKFELQSEFVNANIINKNAWGYYAYAGYYFANNFQVLAQIEKYKDFNPATNDNEWYLLGLNYYFTQKNKLMADYRTQFNGKGNINIAEIQYQIFFN